MNRGLTAALILFVIFATGCQSQTEQVDTGPAGTAGPDPVWTSTHDVAWDIVAASDFVTLITLDAAGQPQARMLEAIPPDSGQFNVWMGTNVNSAKVQEINNDPRATLYYQRRDNSGYVTLRGRADIVDDPVLKEKYWRPHWTAFYPDPETMYVLIHFTPENGEVVSLSQGIRGDSLTWAAPEFGF